jgi:S1-C subfamily serine protease
MSNPTVSQSLLPLSNAVAALVREAGRRVVGVHSQRSRASGWFWRPQLIVAPSDVIADEGPIRVTLPGGDTVEATLKGRDPSTDVALLRVERADVTPVTLSPEAVEAGAITVVVGAAEGTPTAALGVVSRAGGNWRSVRGGDMGPRIELDVVLRASAEGGVVVDAAGHAIGMAVFGPRKRVLVIPAATIERVASQLDRDGRIARGYLGLGLQPVRLDNGGEGAMVMSVDATGPAAAAGVRQGDIVVGWNGQPLRTVAIVRELGPGSVASVVRMSATRAGEPVEFDVTIGARPDA